MYQQQQTMLEQWLNQVENEVDEHFDLQHKIVGKYQEAMANAGNENYNDLQFLMSLEEEGIQEMDMINQTINDEKPNEMMKQNIEMLLNDSLFNMEFNREMIEPELKALYNQNVSHSETGEVSDHKQFHGFIRALLDFYQNVSLKRMETIDILNEDFDTIQKSWTPE